MVLPGMVWFAAALLGSPVLAEQLRVNAEVTAVTPITEGGQPICDVPPPQRDAGLAAALRWDLYERCRPGPKPAVVTGYRVEYRWDGRTFSTVLAEPPEGDTLALRIDLE